jgi:hypothetical protein
MHNNIIPWPFLHVHAFPQLQIRLLVISLMQTFMDKHIEGFSWKYIKISAIANRKKYSRNEQLIFQRESFFCNSKFKKCVAMSILTQKFQIF